MSEWVVVATIKWHWPVRAHLGALAAVTALPFLALIAYNIAGDVQRQLALAGERAARLATLTSAQAERFLQRTRLLATRLSGRPALRALDPERCDPLFGDFLELYPEYSNFLTLDADGQPVCSALPLKGPRPWQVNPAIYLAQAKSTRAFTVGRPVKGFVTDRWVVMLVEPILGISGEVAGLVALPMDLASYGLVPASRDLPPGVAVRVVDARGRVIADASGSEADVGADVSSTALFAAIAAGGRGGFRNRDADGIERVYGFDRVEGTDWRVAAGFPVDAALASMRASVATSVLAAFAGLLAAGASAYALSRRIAGPVEAIADGARRVAEGRLDTRVSASTGPEEIVNVTSGFNAMLDQIQSSELQMRNLFEQAADGIFVLDSDHNIVQTNARGGAMFGYDREALAGMPMPGFLAEHELARVPAEGAAILDGAAYLAEWTFRRRDGSTFPAEVSARVFSGTRYLAIIRDLSARRQAEEERREAAVRLQLAASAGKVGLWDWDIARHRVFYSTEWKSLIGYADAEIANEYSEWESRVHPGDLPQCTAAIDAFLKRPQDDFHVEFRLRHKDGSYRWFISRGALLHDAEGRPVRMIGSNVDVTQLKDGEEALREQARRVVQLYRRLMEVQEAERRDINRELHDRIGQDLAAVKLNVSLLRSVLGAEAAAGARLEEIQRLVQNAIEHSRNIMAELRPPGLDEHGLVAALEILADTVARRLGIAVSVSARAGVPRLPGAVETALYRIVQEALSNVSKHAQASTVTITLVAEAGGIELAVSDDGRGFDTSAPEAGYGMRTMRERAEAVGARLDVSSATGRGARVAIILDLTA